MLVVVHDRDCEFGGADSQPLEVNLLDLQQDFCLSVLPE
jgi:hypothetical protein